LQGEKVMADEKNRKVNPNTADEEMLLELPGIGPALAKRIIAARPFSRADDLQNIRGFGKAAFERVEPYLSLVETEVDDQTDLEKVDLETAFNQGPEASEAEKLETAVLSSSDRPNRTVKRSEVVRMIVVGGVVTLILSVLTTLAIISGINSTLDFNRLRAVRQLQDEMNQVQRDQETLSSITTPNPTQTIASSSTELPNEDMEPTPDETINFARDLEDFDPTNFDHPTKIDNRWFPLLPGTQFVFEGFTEEGGRQIPHSIIFTVTDLTKEIANVRTVVAWVVDYSDGVVVEAELAFYAQDNDGTVWFLGEYPEVYERGKLVEAPAWISGFKGARAGIVMKHNPEV
jgi:hypothetical protein